MIEHHHRAVMMAMLCEERAVHPELRELCGAITEVQMAEIERMHAWLHDWYGIEHEIKMSRRHERDVQELAELSGPDFEIEFMEMMIRHHAAAVREGRMCLRKAYHPELISLCQNIVTTQTAEMAMMENWLCQWYAMCD